MKTIYEISSLFLKDSQLDFYFSLPVERREIIFCPSYETQNCLPECLLKGLEQLEHPLRMKWSKTAHFKLRKMIAGHALANKAKFEEFASYDKDDARLLTRRTKNLRISVIYMISNSII